ncbi:hypothetical protein B0H17DRAFT_1212133 [Mycena rosella]|uniref:Uncharacterized protein n=1 Tax=Mycena rosella TaxID=1033263 RepID=A0AAD7CSI6_MYCRO|nr:hypothetical protein B0H17DRAFT_1212133 [Mycena rosella]
MPKPVRNKNEMPDSSSTAVNSEDATPEAIVVETSPHAAAQARYRAKNAEAVRAKARIRMRKYGTKVHRKEPSVETQNGETYEEFMACEHHELRATTEYAEFREYCNKVQQRYVRVDYDNPKEVLEWEAFLRTNPCVEDMVPFDEDYIEGLWHERDDFPEWKDELALRADIYMTHTRVVAPTRDDYPKGV